MINGINLLHESSGVNIATLSNITRAGGDVFAASFLPPAEGVVLQLVGMDGNGLEFSYISNTAFKATPIKLALSMTYYAVSAFCAVCVCACACACACVCASYLSSFSSLLCVM